jgi:CRP/FNR family transcriptional regulator, cyclic AMP receptor protein
MTESEPTEFDTATFLAKAGLGRWIIEVKAGRLFFAQGSLADSVFYLQKGRVRITIVSERGKEATITLLSAGDFIGEESVAGAVGLRLATATAITACMILHDQLPEQNAEKPLMMTMPQVQPPLKKPGKRVWS